MKICICKKWGVVRGARDWFWGVRSGELDFFGVRDRSPWGGNINYELRATRASNLAPIFLSNARKLSESGFTGW